MSIKGHIGEAGLVGLLLMHADPSIPNIGKSAILDVQMLIRDLKDAPNQLLGVTYLW